MDAPISKNPEHKARNIAIFFALMGTVTMIPPVEAVDSILNEDNRNIALVSSNDDKTDDKTALNDLNIDQLIKFCNFYKKSTFSEGDIKFRNTYNEGASDIKLIQTIKNNEQFKNFVNYKNFFKDITEKVRKKIKDSLLKSSKFLKNFDSFDKSFKATEEHQECLANFYYEKFNVVDVNFLNFLKQMFKSRIFLKLQNPTIQTLQEFNDAFASALKNNFGEQWDDSFEGKPYEFFRKIEQLGKNQSTENLTLNDFFKCFSNDDNCDFPNPEVNAQWEEKKRSLFIEKNIEETLSISIKQVQEEASMAIDFLDKKILEAHARKAREKEDKERTIYHESYSKFFRDLTLFFHSDKHENSEEAEKKLLNEISGMITEQMKSKTRTTDEVSAMLKTLHLICNFSMPEKDLMTTKEEELLLSLAHLQPKTAAAIIVLLDGLKKILNNPSEEYTGNLNNNKTTVSQIEKIIEQKKRDKMSEAVESTQKTTVEQLPPPPSFLLSSNHTAIIFC